VIRLSCRRHGDAVYPVKAWTIVAWCAGK
jgi:hypothetical protein